MKLNANLNLFQFKDDEYLKWENVIRIGDVILITLQLTMCRMPTII